MPESPFAGQHVVILGLARQGTALARFFTAQGARVTISDRASAEQLAPGLAALAGLDVDLVLGSHPPSLLDTCDLLCLSGGVPPQIPIVQEARRRNIPLSNDTILTLLYTAAPVAGITGSSGKTTTTTLAGLMLAAGGFTAPDSPGAGPRVWVGGNIGTPLVDQLACIQAQDWLVLELSSFQLELFDAAAGGRSLSPQVAAVLNVTPNHLDRHPSMAHYAACKANILRWQTPADTAILGADDPIAGEWLRQGRVEVEPGLGQDHLAFDLPGRRIGFGLGEPVSEGCWLEGDHITLRLAGHHTPVVATGQVRLRGQHNLQNLAAACAIAAVAGTPPQAMAEVARTFQGVPHRLELVRVVDDVQWVNDSIATTPERAAAALRSFEPPIVLLAGGRDKKLPWHEFAGLVQQRVKHLVVFGEAAGLIARAVTQAGPDAAPPISHCNDPVSYTHLTLPTTPYV
jgi:UDP-N-acetylmuramoylalanine--D-glutamate ligase